MDNGFKEFQPGKYVKRKVSLKEITSAYKIRTKGIYKGYRFAILSEEDDKYLLYGGYHHDIMMGLGFEIIERGVYEKWVSKDELEKVWEEKTPMLGFY